jgi:peptidoglycan/LPS O-acetylase OafA/YrhL
MRRWSHVLAIPVLWTTAAVLLWPGPFDLFTDPFTLSVFVFMVAGAILVAKVPRNSIGTMLLGYASLTSASLVAQALAVAWGSDGVRAEWADTVGVALATAAIMPLPLAMLHFPDGRLPSPRWAPVRRLIFLGALVGVSSSILNGGWGGDHRD